LIFNFGPALAEAVIAAIALDTAAQMAFSQ